MNSIKSSSIIKKPKKKKKDLGDKLIENFENCYSYIRNKNSVAFKALYEKNRRILLTKNEFQRKHKNMRSLEIA